MLYNKDERFLTEDFKMKVKVNQDVCIGCGLCAGLAAALFELTDEGKAQALVDEVPVDEEANAEEAANSCPVGAIER